MDADWSVEMGHDDPVLEFPWASDDPAIRYYDLKHHPELVSSVPEASEYAPIRHFLLALNASTSAFVTAKCDVWQEHFCANDSVATFCRASYIDILFAHRPLQLTFQVHETLVRQLARQVEANTLDAGEAEFVVRRCFYQREISSISSVQGFEAEPGCYVSCYVRGYGQDVKSAEMNWSSALAIVRNALLTWRIPDDSPVSLVRGPKL